jgi:hypothetical protein
MSLFRTDGLNSPWQRQNVTFPRVIPMCAMDLIGFCSHQLNAWLVPAHVWIHESQYLSSFPRQQPE